MYEYIIRYLLFSRRVPGISNRHSAPLHHHDEGRGRHQKTTATPKAARCSV